MSPSSTGQISFGEDCNFGGRQGAPALQWCNHDPPAGRSQVGSGFDNSEVQTTFECDLA